MVPVRAVARRQRGSSNSTGTHTKTLTPALSRCTGRGSNAYCLFGRCRAFWPIICTERRGREAFFIVKIATGVVGPGVSHRYWTRYLSGRDNDRLAVNFSIGPDEFFVLAGDGETFQLFTILRNQAGAGVDEAEADLVVFL